MACGMHHEPGISEFGRTLSPKDGELTSWINAYSCYMKDNNSLEYVESMSMTSSLQAKSTILVGRKLKTTSNGCTHGKWDTNSFTLCGVHYLQKNDYSVKMDQQDFTRKLFHAEFDLPKNLHRMNGKPSWMPTD